LGGLTGTPYSGKVPISTLGQAIVNMGVDPVTGKLTQQDFFVPVGYAKLNSGDKDFSSSGVTLLDPVTVSGGVLDVDNLGGYMNGPGKTDLRKCSRPSKPNFGAC
jgi:hypothetical protein